MTENATENDIASAAGAKAPTTFRSILGEKMGMTQVFGRKENKLFGVTVIKAGPCPILRVKTAESKDGYNAVQLGFGSKTKNVSVPVAGQFKKAGAAPTKWVQEIRIDDAKGLEVGQSVVLDCVFKPGDYVDVQGVTKGRGFAGVMKRHGFSGLPASHGASDKQRSPGSLASRRSLGRVLPGQRMAGHMGHDLLSSLKLEVIKVDAEQNLIYVCGAVPGPRGGLVTVSETVKPKKFRVEQIKSGIKKDKMGNIIKAPTKAVKK